MTFQKDFKDADGELRSTLIIVTRHKALVEYLVNKGIVSKNTHVISHATASDIEGKHVIGVLPMHMAALAVSITEIPLDIPAEMRGKELSLEQVQEYAGEPVKYSVRTEEQIIEHAADTSNRVAANSDHWCGHDAALSIIAFNGVE
jgi:putative CRISPR-associated protein (TIGR02620 family)